MIRPLKTSALLALALILVSASAASARPRHRMTFEFAVMVAADYWQQRNVTVPCHPRELVLSWEETRPWLQGHSPMGEAVPDMLADVAACTVDVTPWAKSWGQDSDPELQADYCAEIAHEVGHLAGLEHPDQPGISDDMRRLVTGTIMGEDATYPFGCEHPRQWLVLHGIHRAPRWVRSSPARVHRLWMGGHVSQAKTARGRWLKAKRHENHA